MPAKPLLGRSIARALCLGVLASLWASPQEAQAQSIIRGPYLQSVTPTSVVLRFELDAPAAVQVHLGPDASYGNVVDAGSGSVRIRRM